MKGGGARRVATHSRRVSGFRGGLVFKAHRLNSRLERNNEERRGTDGESGVGTSARGRAPISVGVGLPPPAFPPPPPGGTCSHRLNFIGASIYDKYLGSMKIATQLDHISLCQTASGTNWSNRWTYRVFIINTRRDEIEGPFSR